MTVRVLTAAQAAELDQRAIAAGTPSRSLMQAAGRAAAALLLERFPVEAGRGVAVFAGPGNNGGDAWVVAGELARRGVRVRVTEVGESKTPDAMAERQAARALLDAIPPDHTEGVIVDGLLGTGATGAPRDAILAAIERVEIRRVHGARVMALDVPSGVDATTGVAAGMFVRADVTVTFGSIKRGLLVNRAAAGAVVAVDIGLADASTAFTAAPELVDAAFVRRVVPRIAADANKGTRKRMLVIGGSAGMAGSTMLAARGAARSGIGMVRLCVAPESVQAVQTAEPTAMAAPWPTGKDDLAALTAWPHVIAIGMGIGRSSRARALVERVLTTWHGPVLLDADAINVFEGNVSELGHLLARPAGLAMLTPHVVEFSRLSGVAVEEVEARRFEIAGELARTLGATILLKGVPTVISDGSATFVSAAGNPALATAGSGDLLSGIAATLLAQTEGAPCAAAAAAWIHGQAAELAAPDGTRGVTLDDIIASLRGAWRLDAPTLVAPVIAALRDVSERR